MSFAWTGRSDNSGADALANLAMDTGRSGRRRLLLGGDAFAAGLAGIRNLLGVAPGIGVTLFADPPHPMVGPLLAFLRDAGAPDVVLVLVADPTQIWFPLIARIASAVCVLHPDGMLPLTRCAPGPLPPHRARAGLALALF